MKFKKQILYVGTASLLIALFILQGVLLSQHHQATKEQLFIALEEMSNATIARLDTIRVEEINSKFEKDLKILGYITLDSTISETGRKLMVRDAKENFNLVEVHFPRSPKTDGKTNLELLLSKNKEMLLEGTVMYWQETLGEKMNEYMNEPWDLWEVEEAVMVNIHEQYPKLKVGLVELNSDALWERTIGPIVKKRIRFNQSITIGVNNLSFQAFSEIKLLVFMTCLVFVLVGFSFYLIMKSWSSELQLISLKEEQLDHLAHEMLTPLSIINIALDRIKDKSEGMVDLEKYVSIAKGEVNRMDIVSKNILLKDGKSEATRIDLGRFLNKYKELAWEGLEVKIGELAMTKYFIQIDEDRLEIVIHSLLENAVKYGEKQVITVAFGIREDSENLILTVSDNGPGISKEDKDKVFQKYYRSEKAKASGKRGFGLGLYHAADILNKANAEITIQDSIVGLSYEIKFRRA